MEKREYNWLDRVDSPRDLKRLSLDELRLYCDELRHYIIEQCAVNPGHLASSLGAVELAAAIHYVFDTPDDRLVWDVGHQAYAHKIITGRREAFRTNRKLGGISGFPRIAESPYDAFGGGHSSVSISAAFGMAKAAELRGEKRQVIAVIGDGAMTGGLAFEGMNNAGASRKTNMLVVLNDNNMAIDQATGALKSYLLHISTSKRYNAFKNRLWRWFAHVPPLLTLCRRAGNAVKHGLLQKSNLFESFNFRYFGPVDGHDVRALVTVLRALKEIDGPKLLHVMTVKGKGYSPAEHNQCEWHAPGRFNPETGERIASADGRDRYQDVFGQTLVDLARLDRRVVGITPAMPSGCSMNLLLRTMPERCFDVGIAEGHAVTFSAGLAAAGIVPFCNIYSTFMQRAYDNVIHDVAIQDLPVVMCLDRGGLVGEDGVTNENSPETDSKKAWGGDIVLKLQTEKPDTFTFKLISSLDLDVLKAVYGDGNVSGTLADGITVTATGEELPEKQWVIDMVMRDNAVKRIYIPSGSISEIGEIVYKDDEEVGYELTIMAMPGSDGATHKEFIKRAAGTGGG